MGFLLALLVVGVSLSDVDGVRAANADALERRRLAYLVATYQLQGDSALKRAFPDVELVPLPEQRRSIDDD